MPGPWGFEGPEDSVAGEEKCLSASGTANPKDVGRRAGNDGLGLFLLGCELHSASSLGVAWITTLPLTFASRSILSRHSAGRLFLSQKIAAVVSGG